MDHLLLSALTEGWFGTTKKPTSTTLAITSSIASKISLKKNQICHRASVHPGSIVDTHGPDPQRPAWNTCCPHVQPLCSVFLFLLPAQACLHRACAFQQTLSRRLGYQEQHAINKCLLTFMVCCWELFNLLSEFFLGEISLSIAFCFRTSLLGKKKKKPWFLGDIIVIIIWEFKIWSHIQRYKFTCFWFFHLSPVFNFWLIMYNLLKLFQSGTHLRL